MHYVVILFDDNGVEVVPETWLQGHGTCYWPNIPHRQIKKKIKHFDLPDISWPVVKYKKILHKNVITYKQGERLVEDSLALHTTDSESMSAKSLQQFTLESGSLRRNNMDSVSMSSKQQFDRESESMQSRNPLSPLFGNDMMVLSNLQITIDKQNEYANKTFGELKLKLNKLEGMLTEQQEVLQQILVQRDKTVPNEKINLGYDLPLETEPAVMELENLLNDARHAERLVNFLSRLGGFSLKETCKRILIKIFTNDVALHFNWMGRGTKIGLLQSKNIVKVIKDSVAMNQIITYNEKDVEEVIKLWLRQAKERKKIECTDTTICQDVESSVHISPNEFSDALHVQS